MADQPATGFRGFVKKPLGKVALVAISGATVFATFAYISPLLAIPVFLLAGLALPIVSGVKRAKFIALSGLVVLLVVAPLATVVYSQQVLLPVGSASSGTSVPDGSGGSVLQNATVAPFSGAAGTNFTWTVTLDPRYLESGLNTTNWKNDSLLLFLSTCPGATGPNSPYCSAGYPFMEFNYTFASKPTNPVTIPFHQAITTNGVWEWQMEFQVQNNSSKNFSRILLVGDPTWNGIEGPVVGGFSTVYGALILDIFLTAFLYLGLPFYFILLLYVFLKNREQRRKEAVRRAATPNLPSSGVAEPSALPGGGGAPPGATVVAASHHPTERTCPSCQAVVYANEAKCWKCGTSLQGGDTSSVPSP